MDERIDILTALYIAEQTFDAGDLEQNLQTGKVYPAVNV